ncbi:MAG: ECF transporter S component [Oscillospiraceae bacterium]|nr:ECF transporter S component [Oscillospiraceae bacterium]
MFEQALTQRKVSFGTKITIKTLVSAGLIAAAVLLPQLVHLALGAPGGVKWLPMYLPVLIGGCLLGAKWGLAVGVLSPLASYLITSAMGNPMPLAARLPFMMAELAVFALVSGLFTKKIAQNGLWAFPAVILAQITGRAAFLGLIALTQSKTQFTAAMIWKQIQTGFIGLAVQAVLVPVIIIALRAILLKERHDD